MIRVYGIGNPLIDLIYSVQDDDLRALGLSRGIMHLIDEDRRDHILEYLNGRPMTYAPGGDCPNTMINLRLLGVNTSFSGKIGHDDFGRMYEDRLTACGVESDLSHGNGKTGSSIILVSPDGERTMNTYLGMSPEYGQNNINRRHIAECDYLYTTGYMWDTQNQKDAISLALSLVEGFGKAVAFDLADPFAVGRYRDDFLWLLERHVDITFANAEEVKLLFPGMSFEDCVRKLASMVRICAVKDGAQGSFVSVDGEIRHVPAFPVSVSDTTGAGDTYAAGFMYGLICGADISNGSDKGCSTPFEAVTIDLAVEAGRIAGWLAARIITRPGAQLRPEEAPEIRTALERGAHRI